MATKYKFHRNYTLPTALAARLSPGTKSEVIRTSVQEAAKDPFILCSALKGRLSTPTEGDQPVARYTFNIDVTTLESLDQLSKASGLPVEHVMRLALEAQMSKN